MPRKNHLPILGVARNAISPAYDNRGRVFFVPAAERRLSLRVRLTRGIGLAANRAHSGSRSLRDAPTGLAIVHNPFLFQEQCQRRSSAHRIGRVEERAAREHRPDSEAVPRRQHAAGVDQSASNIDGEWMLMKYE